MNSECIKRYVYTIGIYNVLITMLACWRTIQQFILCISYKINR